MPGVIRAELAGDIRRMQEMTDCVTMMSPPLERAGRCTRNSRRSVGRRATCITKAADVDRRRSGAPGGSMGGAARVVRGRLAPIHRLYWAPPSLASWPKSVGLSWS